jgi:DHA1 family multidrug resistance protein-like MFS transporter
LSWRRNLVAVTTAGFTGFMGFTLVMPFLPLYFRELGVRDVGAIALWSGVSLGVTPAVTAICAPAWGALADRFGRKLMVVRSLVSFIVVMTAMAFVTAPWQVLALRALQGLFAGYGALILTMTVESSPPEHLARSIGIVQTAQRMAPAIGPIVGGTLAQLVGLRRAFLVSTLFYVLALALILILYRERSAAGAGGASTEAPPVRMRDVLTFQNFMLIMVVIFGVHFVDRSFGPVLPLFLEQLGTPTARVPLVAGSLFSITALSGAVGHHLCSRMLERASAARVIAGGLWLAAVGVALMALVTRASWLFVATPWFGIGLGLAITAAYTTASQAIPRGVEGRAFGVLTSAALAGLALSPIVSGLVGAVSIRAVFVVDVIALAALAGYVTTRMRRSPLTQVLPRASCASGP